MADNNQQNQQAPAREGQNAVPVPRPDQNQARRPPAPTGLDHARDLLMNTDRVILFGQYTRNFGRARTLAQAFTTSVCDIYATLFRSMWNCGFSSIVPNIQAANIRNQCTIYARNYVHNLLIDTYNDVREVALKENPDIALAHYLPVIGKTGHKYDAFARELFNLLHPVTCNNALEETLVYVDFNIDTTRDHGNWFNLADVADGDLTQDYTYAIFDTLDRAKTVTMSNVQFGTARGSGASLIDFYPRDNNAKAEAYTWLNMDNNYNDKQLTVMYIIAQDLFTDRFGPRFEHDLVATPEDRNLLEPPFYAEIIFNEDETLTNQLRAFHVNSDGREVQNYEQARTQEVEVIPMYRRTHFMYRKKVLQEINEINRYQAFKIIVEK
jgi:hypothetical protein